MIGETGMLGRNPSNFCKQISNCVCVPGFLFSFLYIPSYAPVGILHKDLQNDGLQSNHVMVRFSDMQMVLQLAKDKEPVQPVKCNKTQLRRKQIKKIQAKYMYLVGNYYWKRGEY